MSNIMLLDEAVYPSEDILSAALGDIYPAYRAFCDMLEAAQVAMEWRYYKDSKAWLCKCQHRKKTVFWLSIWEGYFQTGFFFTQVTSEGVPAHLQIFEKPVGKFLPIVMKIDCEGQLGDLELLIAYKKSLK